MADIATNANRKRLPEIWLQLTNPTELVNDDRAGLASRQQWSDGRISRGPSRAAFWIRCASNQLARIVRRAIDRPQRDAPVLEGHGQALSGCIDRQRLGAAVQRFAMHCKFSGRRE